MFWGIISSLWTWPLLENEDRVVTAQMRFLPTNCLHVSEANADPFPEMRVSDSLGFAGYWKELKLLQQRFKTENKPAELFWEGVCHDEVFLLETVLQNRDWSLCLVTFHWYVGALTIYATWSGLCNTLLQFFSSFKIRSMYKTELLANVLYE